LNEVACDDRRVQAAGGEKLFLSEATLEIIAAAKAEGPEEFELGVELFGVFI
jgi:hypothetical protein